MKTPRAEDVKSGIAVLWETLQCPICLDLMTTPVSTKCDHQFCKFCMEKVLNNTNQKEANCPVCKSKITRRGLQESPGFQRLVAGLQDMIQAYQQDTGTNYFTGRSQKRRQSIITATEIKNHPYGNGLSEDQSGNGLANEENEDSLVLLGSNSSTVAAKRGFASLMGFEDTCPFTVEDEGLDSGLGDAPPLSETKMCVHSPSVNDFEPFIETEISQVVERATSCPKIRGKNRITNLEASESHLILIPDEKQHQPLRQSSRISNKLQLNSDKNFTEKEKKSLEKVAEWLMKVPTTEESSELQRNQEQSFEVEPPSSPTESCSSTSTIQLNQDNSYVNHKREEHSKGLEEQVFGAVYKRERRGKRSFPPQLREYLDPPVPPLPEETQTPKKSPKKKKNKDLTPADFVKKSNSGDKNESIFEDQKEMQQPTSDTTHFKETEQMLVELSEDLHTTEAQGEEREKFPYIDNNKAGEDVNSPMFVLDQLAKTKKSIHDTLQNVDSDLQKQANTKLDSSDIKRTGKKRGKNAKPDKGKSVRVSKPLELVGVQERECIPTVIPKTRPGTEEIRVQIESYPSSEDLGTPVTRTTRNRRQLQVFTNQVQQSHKKKAHASKNRNGNICDAENHVVKQSEKAKASTPDDIFSLDGNIVKSTQINGCICVKDIGGVEKMEPESTSTHLNLTEAITPVKEPISDVFNAQSPHKACMSFIVAEVPSSRSPIEATVQIPVLENVNHTSPPSNNVVFENVQIQHCNQTSAQCSDIEKEEDKNDSELDTEQLLKSFRGTKRKSFLLGSPNVKRNHIGSHKEDLTSSKTKENCHVGFGTEATAKDIFTGTKESSIIHQETITLSHSQSHDSSKLGHKHRKGLKRAINSKSDQVVINSSNPNASGKTQDSIVNSVLGNTISSGLSPNKVAKSQPESHHSSVIQAIDSGVLFPALSAPEEDISNMAPGYSKHYQFTENKQDCGISDIENMPHLRESISPVTAAVTERTCTEKSVELGNTEASLTPDGLVSQAEQLFEQAVADGQGSGDLSASSPIKSNAMKRRMAQRLESSSSSDCSEEELPSLAKIFKTSACPPAVKQDSSLLLEDNAYGQQGSRLTAERFVDECVEADAPLSASLDIVHSSQASVDLFGTQDESDVPGNDVGVSMESSQFSSEVLVTQQKIAMQEELVRLEKLIGLVSEVLQEKEGNPAPNVPSDISLNNQSSKSTGHDLHMPMPCDQGATFVREATPDGERELCAVPPDSRASDSLAPPQAKHDDNLPLVAQNSRLTRQSIKGSGAANASYLCSGGKPTNQTINKSGSLPAVEEAKETNVKATITSLAESKKCGAKLVFVSSGLGPSEQVMVKKFAKKVGGHVVSQVTAEVTHIIIRTDGQLVCERTLKYFMGIAGRKWVVSFQWISECFKQGKLLDESPFEVQGDVVNGPNHQGPMKARTTGDEHLLMKGYKICFQGQFTDMTTDQMEWMVQLCGADIVKDPLLFNENGKALQLLIVQGGSESAQWRHNTLQTRATVLTRGWLLDTVATYTLQNHDAYRA